jgi:hypothetical protein
MTRHGLTRRFGFDTFVKACLSAFSVLAVMTAGESALAQGRIELVHRAPDLREQPAGRSWVPIILELHNTKDIDLKVRLVGSRDGRFMDVTLPRGALNAADIPTYQMEVPAPLAAMTYQFVVHQPDGSLITSKRFTMQRACVQNYKVEIPESDPNGVFKRKVAGIVAQAGSLERDLGYLDAAVKILEEIRTNIPN